jgi:uncharacterized OB-fold protein
MKKAVSLAAGALLLAAASFASAACKDCGTVSEVRPVTKEMKANAATAKNPVDKGFNANTHFQVIVKMDDGKTRSFTFMKQPEYKAGDKVKLVDGMRLTRQ